MHVLQCNSTSMLEYRYAHRVMNSAQQAWNLPVQYVVMVGDHLCMATQLCHIRCQESAHVHVTAYNKASPTT